MNVILTSLFKFTRAVRESGGKKRMAGVVAKEATQKLGYEDVKACQLEVIAGGRDVFVIW